MEHTTVTYKGKKYEVFVIKRMDGVKVPFVVDFDDIGKVLETLWGYKKGKGNGLGYVKRSSDYIYSFLHRYIMKIKDIKITIDHINRIGLDNRKINLRPATYSEQNKNKSKKVKKKSTNLKKVGIDPNEIPVFIDYSKYSNRFFVRVSSDEELFRWGGTNTDEVSLRYKFEEAKKYLRELIDSRPELFEGHMITKSEQKKILKLAKGWNKILRRSGYDFIENFLVDLNDYDMRQYLEENLEDLSKKEKKLLKNIDFNRNKRKILTKLPKDCGVTVSDLPMYCYYNPAHGKVGDRFLIYNHPKLLAQGKTTWTTTTIKTVTTKEKFKAMKKFLKELEKTKI
jgi:hypothetical protein